MTEGQRKWAEAKAKAAGLEPTEETLERLIKEGQANRLTYASAGAKRKDKQ